MKRISVEYKLLGALVLGSMLLAAGAWFALSSGRAYLDASARADHLADAARATSGLLVTMENAESSLRGYLLTGSDAYLMGFLRAPAAASADLTRVRNILEGDAEAALHVTRLGELVPARMAEMKAPAAARPAGIDAAVESLEASDGEARMDEIRATVHALDQLITVRTREAREVAHAHGDDARHAIWILGILVMMLFCGAYAIIVADLRDRRRLLTRLRHSGNRDAATGLPNRRFFGEWLGYATAHARREISHVALLFIDVDGMQHVDELHGREAADALLVEIARRFRETAREGDVLARIGTNQFALAVPDVGDPREIAPLAQRLRDTLTDPALPPLADIPIGASVGVAFYPGDASDSAGVMAAADAAMYAARDAGKNHVAFKAVAGAG